MVADMPPIPASEFPTEPTPPKTFTSMSQAELAACRERLGLRLPIARLMALLSLCQSEHYEPSEQELILLDMLLAPAVLRPRAALLAALQTANAGAALALSELVTACRGANGLTVQPTAERALRVLVNAQQENELFPPPPDPNSGLALSMTLHADAPIASRRGRSIAQSVLLAGSPFAMSASAPCSSIPDKSPVAGDLYSLIPLPEGEDATAALAILLTAKDIAPGVCLSRVIDQDDYLDALLDAACGIETDLSLLMGEDYQSPLPRGYLLCADEMTTKVLMPRVRNTGLTMTVFARATNSGRLTITAHRTALCSLPLPALKNLSRARAIDVRLDGTTTAPVPPAPQVYDMPSHTVLARTMPLASGLSFDIVCRALEEDIAAMKACAIDPATLCLSVGIAESTATSQCALWSCVLALWQVTRAQAIPLLSPVFASDADHKSAITLSLVAKKRAEDAEKIEQGDPVEPILPLGTEQNK